MSTDYKYFAIPFENVPADPSYTVWFATWSKDRPVIEPGMGAPMVVGLTNNELPAGAVLLATSSKDPVPPPPPPPPAVMDQSAYQRTVTEWLAGARDEDE